MQKVCRKEKSKWRKFAGGKNEKCESLFVCVCTTRTDWTTVCLCFPHENTVRPAPPNTHLPNSPAGCIEIRPDLDCFSVQDNRSARRWMNKHEQREWQRGRQTQLAVVQIKAARALKQVNMTFLAARSAGCPRTMDTGHRIVQRRVRRIETRGTENRRGEGGWQAFSKLRKREVKIYWHTHTTRSHTLIQIPLCAMKTCLQTFLWVCVSFE